MSMSMANETCAAREMQAAAGGLKTTVLAVVAGVMLSACAGNTGGKAVTADKVGVLAEAGSSAVKAATLSDAEVKDISEKSCIALDAKSRIAAPKSKESLRLAKIVKGMPKDVNGVTINYKVYHTEEVNAWAMNNGCVRVYSGLMKLMNDNEVRGVIGHEIGHVALGHSKVAMQTAYSATATRQAVAASGNQAAAALSASVLGDMAEKLVKAQFSQVQESAADDYSFDLLAAGKFKQLGLVTAFEKLAKLGDSNSMFSSHPASSDRAKHINERLAEKPAKLAQN